MVAVHLGADGQLTRTIGQLSSFSRASRTDSLAITLWLGDHIEPSVLSHRIDVGCKRTSEIDNLPGSDHSQSSHNISVHVLSGPPLGGRGTIIMISRSCTAWIGHSIGWFIVYSAMFDGDCSSERRSDK